MPRAAVAFLLAALLLLPAACVAPEGGPQPATGSSARPAIVVVRTFEAREDVVAVDPSLGFSLRKGAPGVPRSVRAASVGRAAAFVLSDALVEELQAAGIDAVRAGPGAPPPAGSALVISGVFAKIDEGRRGQGAGHSQVVADATVEYRSPAGAPQRLLDLHEDSAELTEAGDTGGPRRAHYALAGVDADAARVGHAIGRAVVDLARRQNWLGPPR
jgi:hypothetical protein